MEMAEEFIDVETVPRVNKHLSACCKDLVVHVYEGLLRDNDRADALAKTCELTRVPKTTLLRILDRQQQGVGHIKKQRSDKGTFRKLNELDSQIIGKNIYDMYSKNEIPTLKSLIKYINSNCDSDYPRINCSTETLRKFLITMGFAFKTINKRQAIMETERIQKWRIQYLNDIQNYRNQGRQIFYLDETWFDTHDTVKKGWTDNSSRCIFNVPSSRGKRITILHCGSETGWVVDTLLLSAKNISDCSLDYHEDMTADLFENWFQNTLLPKLPENSVIVLDNASYHSRLKEKIPNKQDNKNTIQEFLMAHDLYYEDSYKKDELLEVLGTKTFNKSYVIDTIAKDNGHDVLRLPPYHCILNPIELIWGQLKNGIRKNNNNPKLSASVLSLVRNEANLITAEAWNKSVEHVKKIEASFKKSWENVTPLVIDLGQDSSSESDCE